MTDTESSVGMYSDQVTQDYTGSYREIIKSGVKPLALAMGGCQVAQKKSFPLTRYKHLTT